MTTLQKEAITTTYFDTKGMIGKAAWDFYNQYGGDFEDWKSEANMIFTTAYYSHNSTKGIFTTWLYFQLDKKLREYTRKMYKHQKKIEADIATIPERIKDRFSFINLLDETNKDATTIINLVCNPTKSFVKQKIGKGNHPCHMKKAIGKHLTTLGWTVNRIKESFQEVERILHD